MSRVERTENPRPEPPRQAQKKDPNVGHTPSKAEGEQSDVEEALKHQQE